MNSKKTDHRVTTWNNESNVTVNIFINQNKLKQKDQFKYLYALILNNGRNNIEIASRITQAKMNFQSMKSALTN